MSTSQPRVLHIVPALFGTTGVVGGAERYAFELARHMADRVPTRLLSFGSKAVEIREGNLDVKVRTNRALFVGRLLPHKGIATLIDALPDTMALDIVGPPNTTGEVESPKVQAAGKPIVFHHDIGDKALVDTYRQALCLVLPSVYRTADGQHTDVRELLGQTLLEAMACATPVICTRVASMPEIVEDGVSGFVVEPGDTGMLRARLSWLAEHPSEAVAMGAAGRKAVLDRFQWPRVVERCLEAYARP